MAHRLTQAADRVTEAKQAMDQSIGAMEAAPVDLQTTQAQQVIAVEKLAAALELLAPPPQDQKQQEQQQPDQQSPQDQSSQQKNGQQEKGQDPDQTGSQQRNAARLLQAVRDRQAQRQRERGQKRPAGYTPVEKDW